MAWIESHTVLVRHRKTVSFAAMLGIKPAHAVGHLHVLWHTVLEQAEDGDISQWDDMFVASSAGWEGDPALFRKALRAIGFEEENGLIHDWLDYAWRYLSSRYKTSNPERLEAIRNKHKSAFSLPKVCLKASHQPTNQPNQPTKPICRFSFEEIWKKYPNKDGRKQAERFFLASVKTEQDWKDINKALDNYLSSDKPQKGYIKNGSTWFNNWRDWVDYQGAVGSDAMSPQLKNLIEMVKGKKT